MKELLKSKTMIAVTLLVLGASYISTTPNMVFDENENDIKEAESL